MSDLKFWKVALKSDVGQVSCDGGFVFQQAFQIKHCQVKSFFFFLQNQATRLFLRGSCFTIKLEQW